MNMYINALNTLVIERGAVMCVLISANSDQL